MMYKGLNHLICVVEMYDLLGPLILMGGWRQQEQSPIDQLMCAAVLMSVDACFRYCMDGQHRHAWASARMRLTALGAAGEKARVSHIDQPASSTGLFNLLRWTPVKAPCLPPKP